MGACTMLPRRIRMTSSPAMLRITTGRFLRVDFAGFKCLAFRGNVFAYANSSLNAHAAWNIDWGGPEGGMQTGRGHRQAIMSLDGE